MSTITTINSTDNITDSRAVININFSNLNADKQETSGKDTTGGYAGLTLFKINFKNAANTFTNFFTNATTAARTYTFPDKDITVAGIVDITGTNSGTNTGDETAARIATINHGASVKSALVDADEITGQDSAASFALIRTTWTSVKAFLKTYFDTLYVTSGGALGTPSSATLTSATGLPIAGLVASTSAALGVGSIELGHATDTSITRVSAGVIAVEGVTIATSSNTLTLTNKRITPRILSAASYTTDTGTSLNIDNYDNFYVTAQAGALLFNNPTGTPTEGQTLIVRIKDNATARALTYGTQYRAMGNALPTTTVLSKTLYMGFIYNITDTKWDIVAVAQEA